MAQPIRCFLVLEVSGVIRLLIIVLRRDLGVEIDSRVRFVVAKHGDAKNKDETSQARKRYRWLTGVVAGLIMRVHSWRGHLQMYLTLNYN